MLCNCGLSDLEQVQPPLQNVAKRRFSQLLEELLADLGEEDRDLVLVVLLLEKALARQSRSELTNSY